MKDLDRKLDERFRVAQKSENLGENCFCTFRAFFFLFVLL